MVNKLKQRLGLDLRKLGSAEVKVDNNKELIAD